MFRPKITSLVALLMLPLLSIMAQDDASLRLIEQVARVQRYSLYHPQEKVYLHFDNTGYFQGETMHFKAYVLRTDTQRLTDLSRILYVDLLTPNGDVVVRRKLKVVNGLASGDIQLDELLLSGFYEVRAYTRYMTTWGTDACFSRVLPIFREPLEPGDYSQMHLDAYEQPTLRRKTVNFYPEGGDLVEGLTSRVAYTVMQADSEVVRRLIEVTPIADKPLKVEGVALPQALREGIVLRLDPTQDHAVIATLRASAGMRQTSIGYALMHNGQIQQADTLTVGEGRTLTFDRGSLQAGVSQLTLFNADGHILAERLFFVCPQVQSTDSIRITTPTQVLEPLGKVRFDIHARPFSSLSFSAIDAATATGGRVGNLRTNLLLSSDLRGYVAHPEQYFEADDSLHRAQSDLLMLVQGWRRYDWQVMNGTLAQANRQPIELNLKLNGRLVPVKKRISAANTTLDATLVGPNKEILEGTLQTDEEGNYNFDLPDIEGTWSLLLSGSRDKDKTSGKRTDYNIRIDRNFEPARRQPSPFERQVSPIGRPSFAWGTDESTTVETSATHHVHRYLLPEVLVKKRTNNWRGWTYEGNAIATSIIHYNCEEETDRYIDQGEEIPPLDEWLHLKNSSFDGKCNFMDVVSTDSTGDYTGSFYRDGISYHNRPIIWILNNKFWSVTSYRGPKSPLVTFCDNQFSADDQQQQSTFPVFLDDVKSLYISTDMERVRQHVVCDDVARMDPVVVYCYTIHKRPFKMKGERLTQYHGFDVPHYYEMDYSGFQPLNDIRRTLHWNASVATDAEGRATVEFYNNLTCTDMILSVEGITLDGALQTY